MPRYRSSGQRAASIIYLSRSVFNFFQCNFRTTARFRIWRFPDSRAIFSSLFGLLSRIFIRRRHCSPSREALFSRVYSVPLSKVRSTFLGVSRSGKVVAHYPSSRTKRRRRLVRRLALKAMKASNRFRLRSRNRNREANYYYYYSPMGTVSQRGSSTR